jgi:hypothetical protein
MPASQTRGASHRLSRPAFENLQRTKPRGMKRGRAATAYGDLKALAGRATPRSALPRERFSSLAHSGHRPDRGCADVSVFEAVRQSDRNRPIGNIFMLGGAVAVYVKRCKAVSAIKRNR